MPLCPSLKKRREFLKVAHQGKYWSRPTLIVQRLDSLSVSDAASKEIFRVGFTASKRVGNAVKRNKAKRRMREVVHLWLKNNTFLPAGDWVIIAKKSLITASFKEIQKDFEKAVCQLETKDDSKTDLLPD